MGIHRPRKRTFFHHHLRQQGGDIKRKPPVCGRQSAYQQHKRRQERYYDHRGTRLATQQARRTGRGAEQVLTLEDGTIVQINAASELLFPTHFTKQARQIQLAGEAYLKVKADKENPFIVHLGILDVQVTGTAFNVKAYEEENEISIALVEGIISVYKEKQLLAELLPGQLFTFRKDEQEYTVTDTDLSTVTDWTEDQFIFYNETIENIMHKISRWYNVNISVDEKIKNARYTGILSRKQPLVKILDALRMTDELEFDIQADKKIDVEKKN